MKGFHRSADSGSLPGCSEASASSSRLRAVAHETAEMQKVAAQTNAVITSTGGVAGVTAEHVEELGKSLLNLSGIDDEVIKNSENLLLTSRTSATSPARATTYSTRRCWPRSTSRRRSAAT